jgi:hypothetical protein
MTFPPHIKWCGLFAAWVWRQANVGVYFKTEEKRKPGGYGGIWRQSPDQYLGSSGRLKFLDMGDIIVFQPGPYHDENGKVKNGRNHHAIIIATYEDGAVVDMVEGNATGPKGDDPKTNIVQFTQRYDFRIKKKEEKQFYSVDTFMDPKVRY